MFPGEWEDLSPSLTSFRVLLGSLHTTDISLNSFVCVLSWDGVGVGVDT